MPDVEAAGITTALPILESSAMTSVPITIDGQPPRAPGQEPVAQNTTATAGYFPAIGARLLRGRLFNQFDTSDSLKVAFINDTMAKRYWPNEDPVGRKFKLQRGSRTEPGPVTLEIAGVVSDLRQDGLGEKPATRILPASFAIAYRITHLRCTDSQRRGGTVTGVKRKHLEDQSGPTVLLRHNNGSIGI